MADHCAAPPVRLTVPGRTVRAVLTVGVAALLTAGTLVGDDHWYPVGPFRMFSTATKPDGFVNALSLEVRTAGTDWQRSALAPHNVGVNRAEVEGRTPQLVADPSLLGDLAAAHARLHSADEPWIAVRVVQNRTEIRGGRPTNQVTRTVVASWER
jgi:hypothetical protein